ncbi:guanine deaminase [Brucella sp. NBRC 12950]|uniref:guanine deaminase n=1 Tax=Brucella sp. NBRC 12950 TaxID=2994518 RepID=UPI0024A12E9B|nr:guanine deaminase [Brucella sp. NBRC 12950]GLU25378.1 chlorohydrolase [Brucella sp. NBRC 12950]
MHNTVICGAAFHTPELGRIEAMDRVAIAVDSKGIISRVEIDGTADFNRLVADARASNQLIELEEGSILMPGLVDLHIHAPQWPQLGKALDEPLEVWLQKYTFPLEAKYEDVDFARIVYRDLVRSLLAHGTTTAVYFATTHVEASVELAQICLDEGQRAFVGKVAMDDPEQCPAYYRDENAHTAIADTRAFIDRVRALDGREDALVRPIITPRFIPSCSDALLQGLGDLAAETGCLVQTHCSESDWERDFVLSRHGRTDSEVLRDFGLLREHTVLAHSNFVNEEDLQLIREKGAAVAHCPLSNFYFANAVFPLRKGLDMKVRTGLGSDISGGHSPSVLDACRHALTASRAHSSGVDASLPAASRGADSAPVTVAETLWLATAGGGEAIGLPVGKFAPGFRFDAILIDTNRPASPIKVWPGIDTLEEMAAKIVLNAGRESIARVWVEGREVLRS